MHARQLCTPAPATTAGSVLSMRVVAALWSCCCFECEVPCDGRGRCMLGRCCLARGPISDAARLTPSIRPPVPPKIKQHTLGRHGGAVPTAMERGEHAPQALFHSARSLSSPLRHRPPPSFSSSSFRWPAPLLHPLLAPPLAGVQPWALPWGAAHPTAGAALPVVHHRQWAWAAAPYWFVGPHPQGVWLPHSCGDTSVWGGMDVRRKGTLQSWGARRAADTSHGRR